MKTDDDQRSTYQMIRWKDYKKDFKPLEENNFFWVRVQKSEITDFLSTLNVDLDTQLFGFEWPTRDEFRFLLLSKNAKAFHTLQKITKIQVNLGHKDRLMFQDFQVHFEVERREILAVLREDISDIGKFLKNILKVAVVPKEYGTKSIEDILSRFPESVKRNDVQSRYITKDLTLECFVFDPERINKYCTACFPDRLDFLLTYRNTDIVMALKTGPDSLKKYLENCPLVSLMDPRIAQTVSLLFPTYLRSYMMYSYQLLSQYDSFYSKRLQQWKREFTNWKNEKYGYFREDYTNSLKKRKYFQLDDLWNVLCVLSNDPNSLTQEFRRMYSKKMNVDVAELSEKVNATFKILESYRSDNSGSIFPPERVAQSYDRSIASESKLADYSCDEDIVRYFSTAQRRVDIDQVSLRASVDWLRREFKSCFKGLPRCDFELDGYVGEDLFHITSHSFIGTVIPQDHYRFDMTGTLWPYLCDSSWYDHKIITDRTKLPLEYRAKIYARYLDLNEDLSFIISRVSCLPVIHKALKDLSECFCSVEQTYLKELIEEPPKELPENNQNLSDDETLRRFNEFRGYVNNEDDKNNDKDDKNNSKAGKRKTPLLFRLLPKTHLDMMANVSERKERWEQDSAEKEREIAEVREKTQREVFTEMNHSIKNLIASVKGNLSMMDMYSLDDEARKIVLRRAKQGTVIVAQITEAITHSYRRMGNDWKADLLPDNACKLVWNDVITNALFSSISNMFIDTYEQYQQESSAYFSNQEDLPSVEKSWYLLKNAEAQFEWIRNHMFNLELRIADDVYKLKIGRQYATHLIILFNELFLNAIKAAAYVQKDQRSLSLCLQIKEEMLVVDLSNSCNRSENPSMRSHGFGQLIIENYRKMFQIDDFSGELLPDKNQYRQHFSIQIISKS